MNLREKLLSLDIFVENEYFDKYIDLVKSNENTPVQKYKTQRHHIIPRAYYKYLHIDVDHSSDNTVNLMFRDHILAHCFMYKCAKVNWFIRASLCAIRRMLHASSDVIIQTLESDSEMLSILQDYYEQSKHLNCLHDDTRYKISQSLKGRISIEKNGHFKYIYKDDLSYYQQLGWICGHNKQTADSKKHLSQIKLGLKAVHKDDITIFVKNSEFQTYLNSGWMSGYGSNKPGGASKGYIGINKDNKVNKYVKKDELDLYLSNGWQLGSKRKLGH